MSADRVLSLRELNRALLARQLLLERRRLPVQAAVERICAIQAQWPQSPYIALWTRLIGFPQGAAHAGARGETRREIAAVPDHPPHHERTGLPVLRRRLAARGARHHAWGHHEEVGRALRPGSEGCDEGTG